MVPSDVVYVSGKIRDPRFDYFKADLISHDRQYLSTRAPVTCVLIALDKNSHQRTIYVAFVFFRWLQAVEQHLCAMGCYFFQSCNDNLSRLARVKPFCSSCSFIPGCNHAVTDGANVSGSQKWIQLFSCATRFKVISRWSCSTLRRLIDTWRCFKNRNYALWCPRWYWTYAGRVKGYLIIILRIKKFQTLLPSELPLTTKCQKFERRVNTNAHKVKRYAFNLLAALFVKFCMHGSIGV